MLEENKVYYAGSPWGPAYRLHPQAGCKEFTYKAVHSSDENRNHFRVIYCLNRDVFLACLAEWNRMGNEPHDEKWSYTPVE